MDATVNLSLTHPSHGQKNLVKFPGLIMVALEPPPTSLFPYHGCNCKFKFDSSKPWPEEPCEIPMSNNGCIRTTTNIIIFFKNRNFKKKIVETLILPMILSRMVSTIRSFWDLGCFWVNRFLSNCDWEEEERRIVIINFLFHWFILKEIRSIWEVWKLFHCLRSCDGGGRRENSDGEKEIRCRAAYHALADISLIHEGWYELLIHLRRHLITNPWLFLY